MLSHPPKPRLTLRVGITGHRPNKLSGVAITRIKSHLPPIFQAVDSTAKEILRTNATVYSTDPPIIRLISSLAQGVDQIAVSTCPSNWQVEAVLPFPMEEYLKDFAATGDNYNARAVFLEDLQKASVVTTLPYPKSGRRANGYTEAGGYLLRQIDVLIAVWDGKPPSAGGTGAIARKAFESGIPVIWLSTIQDRAPQMISDFDENGTPIASGAACTEGPLAEALAPVFAPPILRIDITRKSHRARLERFLDESWRPRCYLTGYDWLRQLAKWRVPRLWITLPTYESRSSEWDGFFAHLTDIDNLPTKLKDVLLPRFAWADTLAMHCSHLYRGAYVLAYLISAFSVFLAVGGFLHEREQHAPALTILFEACELLAIGTILFLIWMGRHFLWHERWLDYRALAEGLRCGRFLAFVSEFGRIQPNRNSGGESPSWVVWYLRATMREIGLPAATLDATYQWRLLDATLKHDIMEQLAYHASNREVSKRIDNFLHYLGIACFLTTLIALSIFFVSFLLSGIGQLDALRNDMLSFIPFLSAGFPALGAAIAGIRALGEFEASKERSVHMLSLLSGLRDEYTSAKNREMDLNETAEMLVSTARVMSEDLAAWQALYGRKRLSLPG
jgi:hypothetical protein